jgi:hypothetical protein
MLGALRRQRHILNFGGALHLFKKRYIFRAPRLVMIIAQRPHRIGRITTRSIAHCALFIVYCLYIDVGDCVTISWCLRLTSLLVQRK